MAKTNNTQNTALNTDNGTINMEQLLQSIQVSVSTAITQATEEMSTRMTQIEERLAIKEAELDARLAATAAPSVDAQVPATVAMPATEQPVDELTVLQEADLRLKRTMQTLLIELGNAAGPAKDEVKAQLKKITAERKVTQEGIRKLTANGIRTVSNVQRKGVNGAIDIVANVLKATNNVVCDSMNWVADKVDVKASAPKALPVSQPVIQLPAASTVTA